MPYLLAQKANNYVNFGPINKIFWVLMQENEARMDQPVCLALPYGPSKVASHFTPRKTGMGCVFDGILGGPFAFANDAMSSFFSLVNC